MNTLVITTCFTARVTRLLTLTLLLMFITAALSLLSACGGDDPVAVVIPDANLTGYYSVSGGGSATVNTSTTLDDLQILVNGNRMMIMSASAVVLYDATITDITGNTYTANVVVYENGQYTQSITLSGSINPGTSVSGTFAGGTGLASGSFSNVVRVTGQANAALTQVTGDWTGDANGNPNVADNFQLSLDADGIVPSTFTYITTVQDTLFDSCTINETVPVLIPVTGTALYTVDMTLASCLNSSAPGTHTGLATLRADGALVMLFTNITTIPIPGPCTDPDGCIPLPEPVSGIVELIQP